MASLSTAPFHTNNEHLRRTPDALDDLMTDDDIEVDDELDIMEHEVSLDCVDQLSLMSFTSTSARDFVEPSKRI